MRDAVRTDVETARATSLQNDREISRREELAWTIRQTFIRAIATTSLSCCEHTSTTRV